MSKKLLEPTIVNSSGTANTWTEALPQNLSRKALHVWATSDADRDLILPDYRNPWGLSFSTNTSISIDPILSSPNTFTSMTKGTIIARVKLDSTGAVRTIFDTSDNSTSDYLQFFFDATGKLAAECKVGNVVQWSVATTNALNTAEWYEVKLIHDGVQAELFVDGGSVTQSFSVSTSLTPFVKAVHDTSALTTAVIGADEHGSLGTYLEGDIDSFKIINKTTQPGEFVASYDLDEGTGSTADDDSLYADDGTISNGTWAIRGNPITLDNATDKIAFFYDSHGPAMQRAVWIQSSATSTPFLFWETEHRDSRIR